jgi:hypothetical protein
VATGRRRIPLELKIERNNIVNTKTIIVILGCAWAVPYAKSSIPDQTRPVIVKPDPELKAMETQAQAHAPSVWTNKSTPDELYTWTKILCMGGDTDKAAEAWLLACAYGAIEVQFSQDPVAPAKLGLMQANATRGLDADSVRILRLAVKQAALSPKVQANLAAIGAPEWTRGESWEEAFAVQQAFLEILRQYKEEPVLPGHDLLPE